jgi:hypothetical protein
VSAVLRRPPEVHLFVLWSESRTVEQRILDDLMSGFNVLDVIEVRWTPGEIFLTSLNRMYGDSLVAGSEKEVHCGTGPFLAVIVEDARPRYRFRRTNRGLKLLNSSIFDARRRYRDWTGGGYRVHASDSVEEAERNLVLLFGRHAGDFRAHPSAVLDIRRLEADPVGTQGWSSFDELATVLEAYGAILEESRDAPSLTVVAEDPWWAERIAGGREVGAGVREVEVAGTAVELRFIERPPRRRDGPRGS